MKCSNCEGERFAKVWREPFDDYYVCTRCGATLSKAESIRMEQVVWYSDLPVMREKEQP